jgi:two-component system cell cycle sensor histidine kinase/response regulator CckA
MSTPPEHPYETILVVDDEPSVRTLIERILTMRGYTVLAAAGPEEALALNREHEVDAVITDVMLPWMKGPELVGQLRRHRPQLHALFISGFTSDALEEGGVSPGDAAFVQKPFTGEALTSRLRELLDG